MCAGEICESLGICYCVGHLSHFDNLEEVEVPLDANEFVEEIDPEILNGMSEEDKAKFFKQDEQIE